MNDLVFYRLHLHLPLDPALVTRLLGRLSQSDTPRPLVFETRADDTDIRFLIGTSPEQQHRLTRLLTQHLPGTRTENASERVRVGSSVRLRITPAGLPLDVGATEHVIYNLYAALASRRGGEGLVLQIVFGRGHAPTTVPRTAPGPQGSFWQALVHGYRPATGEERTRLRAHAEQPTIDTVVRVGTIAVAPERRRELTMELLGALRTLEAPGVRLDITREASTALDNARPARPVRLTTGEAALVLGWPLGDGHLPGMPGLHPKQLPAPAALPAKGEPFAVTTAPGDERPVRLDPTGRLQHLVATGPTGSGKSMALAHLILDDIRSGRACVLVDPKRQLVDFILDRIPDERTNVVVVLDAADSHPVGFNPLDTEGRNADIVVDGILAAFKAVFSDGWGPRTEDLLHAGLLTLARAGGARGMPYTLLDLPKLLSDTGFRRTVVGVVTGDATLASFWAAYEELTPGARANIIAAPMNKLRKFVLRRGLASVLGQPRPRFRLRDVFREGKTVLVPLNDALLGPGAAQLLGSLIVSELWMATLERAAEHDPTNRPGSIYIDEVQQFLHLPTSIADALATSRSYGVSWNLAHQFRAQLPTAMRAAFDANARNKIVFACAPDDARDFARMGSGLTAEDFQTLHPYEVYVQLVTGGAPSGWFSARTLPPAESLSSRARVMQASRDRYGRSDDASTKATTSTSEPPVLPSPSVGHRKARRP